MLSKIKFGSQPDRDPVSTLRKNFFPCLKPGSKTIGLTTLLLGSLNLFTHAQTGNIGGVNVGNLPAYHMVFTNGSVDANWQGATKGFAGNMAIDGIQANERTSGSVPFAGTVYTNDATLGAWQNIVNNNSSQANALYNQTTILNNLESSLENVFTQINALPVTTGYSNVVSTSLNGLNKMNGINETMVLNITGGFGISSKINITGDAGDIFILRWDNDANFSNGYNGQVKFQSGGAIVPLGGLKASNFLHVAGDIGSSGGGSNPAAPYPQGPRTNDGTGSLIAGASNFSGGGFFTGYWFTTGAPTIIGSGQPYGNTSSLSNGIFVGGWYSKTVKFSMTSGTSGVYVSPVYTAPTAGSIGNYVWTDVNYNGLNDEVALQGLNNITVQLWRETSTNVYTFQSATTTANDNSGNPGYYNFVINQSGNYKVKFPTNIFSDLLTIQTTTSGVDGNSDANPADGFSPVISMNLNGTGIAKNNHTIDAGYYFPKGQIGNRVWNDLNQNGIQDLGELGIPDVLVTLLQSSTNMVVATAYTDLNGIYTLYPLSPGTYKVQFELPAVYEFSISNAASDDMDSDPDPITGITGDYSLLPNESNNTCDAGLHLANRLAAPVNQDVIIYPNPANDLINIKLTSFEPMDYEIIITDMTGRLLSRQLIPVQKGYQVVTLPLTGLKTGIYQLTVNDHRTKQSFRIIKSK